MTLLFVILAILIAALICLAGSTETFDEDLQYHCGASFVIILLLVICLIKYILTS